MVFIVLAAFGLGCAFGIFAMVPSWWRHRRIARRETARPASLPQPTPTASPGGRAAADASATRWTLSRSGCSGCRWPSGSASPRLGRVALRHAARRREQKDSPKALLQGSQPAAQRAARQGDRRLHRGRPAGSRHLGPALRARQPVPAARRVRARGARASASAGPRRPAPGRSRPCPARAGPGLHEGRPVRPRRRRLQGARRHELRHRGAPGAARSARAGARLARRRRDRPATRKKRHRLVRLAHRALLVRDRARGRRRASARGCRSGAGGCARGGTARRPAAGACRRTRRRARRSRRGVAPVEFADRAATGVVQPDRAALRGQRSRGRQGRRRAGTPRGALRARTDDGAARDPRFAAARSRSAAVAAAGPSARASDDGRGAGAACAPGRPRGKAGRSRHAAGGARPAPRRARSTTRCGARHGRSIAIAAPPAASRPSTISGSVPAASAGTPIRRNGWRTLRERALSVRYLEPRPGPRRRGPAC